MTYIDCACMFVPDFLASPTLIRQVYQSGFPGMENVWQGREWRQAVAEAFSASFAKGLAEKRTL